MKSKIKDRICKLLALFFRCCGGAYKALGREVAEMFCESIDDLESFSVGMVNSIDKKFQDQQNDNQDSDKKSDLVVVLENERSEESLQYIREHYGNPDFSESLHGVDPHSYRLGKAIGKKISINRQLFSKTE